MPVLHKWQFTLKHVTSHLNHVIIMYLTVTTRIKSSPRSTEPILLHTALNVLRIPKGWAHLKL